VKISDDAQSSPGDFGAIVTPEPGTILLLGTGLLGLLGLRRKLRRRS